MEIIVDKYRNKIWSALKKFCILLKLNSLTEVYSYNSYKWAREFGMYTSLSATCPLRPPCDMG